MLSGALAAEARIDRLAVGHTRDRVAHSALALEEVLRSVDLATQFALDVLQLEVLKFDLERVIRTNSVHLLFRPRSLRGTHVASRDC